MKSPFQAVAAPGTEATLGEGPNFRKAVHVWSKAEIDALTLAFAARRPLLVRGEPGSGKSQLARAAAWALAKHDAKAPTHPLVEVVHPRFEASDLLYRFDALARMLDAQLGAQGGWDETNEKYIERGVLWRAFDLARAGQIHPVVLVDEIDKADVDVPNSLLDVLGNRSFDVPMRKQASRRVEADDAFAPLVIFTTNEERELPAAFVRRCVVLDLNPPKNPSALHEWMLVRATAHANQLGVVDQAAVVRAVDQTLADREFVSREGYPKVGLAEAIDLLNAVAELTRDVPAKGRPAEQIRLLDELSAYALVKHPVGEPGQLRAPVGGAAIEPEG